MTQPQTGAACLQSYCSILEMEMNQTNDADDWYICILAPVL